MEMVKEQVGVETEEIEENATIAESLEALEDLEKVTQLLVNDDDSTIEIADVNGNETKSEVEEETIEAELNATESENMSAEQQSRLVEMQTAADFLAKNAAFKQQMDLANLNKIKLIEIVKNSARKSK